MIGLDVIEADLTVLDVDAIVNAANQSLLGGGGVDGAIHRAAGRELLEACRLIPEVRPGVRCPTGESRLTPGFNLSAKYVVHTVGPIWRGGESGEAELLASCYTSALTLAREHGVRTIAFPAISCGIFGYPPHAAAEVAVTAIREFLATDRQFTKVVLVAYGATMLLALRAASTRGTVH